MSELESRNRLRQHRDDLLLVAGVVAIAVVTLYCILNGMKLMPY